MLCLDAKCLALERDEFVGVLYWEIKFCVRISGDLLSF
jgi:hypothetical protein